MGHDVTLGGERLGSGKKMKVNLHGFERSTHDLGYLWRSTMSAGTLVPFMNELALPGDTFDIHLNCDVKTHPTIGPLFGSFKVQLDVFLIPIRLYNSATHNNMLGIGMQMGDVKLPKFLLYAEGFTQLPADLDNVQINPSSIFSYLGIRGVAVIDASEGIQHRAFNAVPWLGYWEIYKNYYSNKMEEEGAVIAFTQPTINKTVTAVTINADPVTQFPTLGQDRLGAGATIFVAFAGTAPDTNTIRFITTSGIILFQDLVIGDPLNTGGSLVGTYDFARWGNRLCLAWDYVTVNDLSSAPSIQRFPLSKIDELRETILTLPPFTECTFSGSHIPLSYAQRVFTIEGKSFFACQSPQEGLALKTYQSDLFNNWLNTEWIDGVGGINDITAVSTVGDKFTIDALQLANKVYQLLNRIAVSGGTFNDWLDAVYDHDRKHLPESPMYMGGLIKELVFQEVVSNSEANMDEGSQPLGTLAGKGVMSRKHKGGDVIVRVSEPSYIMGIVSLTPRVDYSQGNKWDVNLDSWDDFHKPNLDQIGFQELITEQMAWWTTRKVVGQQTFITKSAGKQPAWINYMTNVNQVRGNFAIEGNEMFMTLNRKYEPTGTGNAWNDIRIKDLTTYIDPRKYNSIFAQTSLDAQNFWVQISCDITARRKMSAKVMPNL